MDYIRILLCLHIVRFGGCFQFSEAPQQDPGIAVQYRQVVPATLPSTLQACTCVPPNTCPVPPTVLPTDGSGQIDIRIVNNVSVLVEMCEK